MSHEELLALDKLLDNLQEKPPQNDDELWEWVKREIGIEIPRVSVCPDHKPPFDFFADVYFERVSAALAMGNRGGGKTYLVALLHYAMGKFKPGCEAATVGAVQAQADRCRDHLRGILTRNGLFEKIEDNPDIARAIETRFWWKHSGNVEFLPGTPKATNGPHPQKCHTDEIELMDPVAWKESRNMALSKGKYRAQDIATSTRKSAHGLMQQLIDEAAEQEANGYDPTWKLYSWCIFENGANVPNCRYADPNLETRREDLTKEDGGCNCDKITSGRWEDGSVRSFETVCRGRLKQSQGYLPLDDIHRTFKQDVQPVWEAQCECIKPVVEHLVFPRLNQRIHGVRNYIPNPKDGPIYEGIDFGAANPDAVGFFQYLVRPRKALGYKGEIELPAGAIVCFDEIYYAYEDHKGLADAIKAKEKQWKEVVPNFKIKDRFPDVQNRKGIGDLYRMKLPSHWLVGSKGRDVKQQIRVANGMIYKDLIYADILRTPMFWSEVEYYHYPEKKPGMLDDPEVPVDDFNHMMSAFRYTVINIEFLLRKKNTGMPTVASPKQVEIQENAGKRNLPTVGAKRYATGSDLRRRARP